MRPKHGGTIGGGGHGPTIICAKPPDPRYRLRNDLYRPTLYYTIPYLIIGARYSQNHDSPIFFFNGAPYGPKTTTSPAAAGRCKYLTKCFVVYDQFYLICAVESQNTGRHDQIVHFSVLDMLTSGLAQQHDEQ